MIPKLYGRDIPQRCEALINLLLHQTDVDQPDFGGPLTTTFLFAMAMPMVLLPMERIVSGKAGKQANPAKELEVDPRLSQEVRRLFATAKFCEAPFFEPHVWSFAENCPKFKVGREWPPQLANGLASEEAHQSAASSSVQKIMWVLRNALAHGGIAYLDATGLETTGEAQMLAFVSKVDAGNHPVSVLRIEKNAFRRFLGLWAAWLKKAGV